MGLEVSLREVVRSPAAPSMENAEGARTSDGCFAVPIRCGVGNASKESKKQKRPDAIFSQLEADLAGGADRPPYPFPSWGTVS